MNRDKVLVIEDGQMRLQSRDSIGLEFMQAVVQGHIEYVQRAEGENGYTVDVWGNEEARLIEGMGPNVMREDGEVLYGPLLVCAGSPDGDSVPLTMNEAMKVQLVRKNGETLPLLHIQQES